MLCPSIVYPNAIIAQFFSNRYLFFFFFCLFCLFFKSLLHSLGFLFITSAAFHIFLAVKMRKKTHRTSAFSTFEYQLSTKRKGQFVFTSMGSFPAVNISHIADEFKQTLKEEKKNKLYKPLFNETQHIAPHSSYQLAMTVVKQIVLHSRSPTPYRISLRAHFCQCVQRGAQLEK